MEIKGGKKEEQPRRSAAQGRGSGRGSGNIGPSLVSQGVTGRVQKEDRGRHGATSTGAKDLES